MKTLLLNPKTTATLFLLLCFFSPNILSAQTISSTTYPSSASTGVSLTTFTSLGTIITTGQDDTNSALTNIGFDFWFNGVRYTQFGANPNGNLKLGAALTTTHFDNDLVDITDVPTIAPIWNDYTTGSDGYVKYGVNGSAPNRTLIIEWKVNLYVSGATGNPSTMTFQAILSESTGKIQFVYGSGMGTTGGYSIGFNTSATNTVSIATATNTATYGSDPNKTQTTAITSGKSYTFTPLVPTAPSGLSFTNVAPTSMTLNWTDNASNEVGYVVYTSTDNITYTFNQQIAANSTTANVTGLSSGTQYYFQVYSVTEGALSTPALTGSQVTPGQATFTTTGTSAFIPPVGVNSVNVQAWGAGGGGGSRTTNGQGGGGGGGAFATSAVSVTGGTSYNLTVGAGGGPATNGGNSTFNTTSVIAEGGKGVAGNTATGGAGGLAANSTGTTKYSGGTGGTASGGTSGGGGGGAGSTGAGGNASVGTAGTGTSNSGGNGGSGVPGNAGGAAGNTYGGGGSGSSRTSSNQTGGTGAQGLVVIGWTCPTYSIATGISATTPASTGSTSTVTVASTSGVLPNGTYTVTYNLSGANTNTNQTASITIASGTGTFTTIAIANAGATTITITNFTNGTAPASCTSAVTANNTTIISINSVTYTTAGTSSFTVPAGITCVKVDAIGGGGGGNTRTSNTGGAGGGGGGAFASGSVAVSSGSSYNVVVGAGGATNANGGDSTFNTTSVVAEGGFGGSSNAQPGNSGGTTAGSTGNIITYKGGDGGTGATNSGAGGGGAGTTGAGGNASGSTAGTGTSLNGGSGGAGVAPGGTGTVGIAGNNYGGGGSGGAANSATNRAGGAGAKGIVTITWVDATDFNTSATASVCPSTTATVTVTSTTLADGTYTVTYNTTNPTTTGSTASMTFSGVTGTFTTVALTNTTSAAVTANITITSITFTGWTCGTTVSAGNTASVTVNPKAAITAMTNTTCTAVGFTSTPVDSTNGVVPAGTTYTWTAPSVTGGMTGGASGSGSSITGTLTNATSSAQTATYTVTPTSGSCGGASFTLTVTVNPKPAITAMTNSACSGAGFTSTPVNTTNGVVPSGTTYSWSAPSVTGGLTGGASGSGASSITGTLTNPTNTAQTATYTVTPTFGSCGGSTFTVTVTVNPTPAITAMTNSACSGVGFTSTPINTTNGVVPSGTTYSWSAPSVTGGLTGGASGSGASSITGTLTNPTNTAQTATYTVTPTSGSCGGSTFTVTVTVNPKATITAMTNSTCTAVGFTSTPANGTNGVVPSGTTYTWTSPSVTGGMTGGASGSGSSITGTLTNATSSAQTATYTVTPTSGSCGGASFTLTVTVNPKAAITSMTNSTCSAVGFTSTPVDSTNGVVPSGTTYTWTTPSVTGGMTGGASGSGSSITGTLTNPTNTAQTATYTVTPTSGSCGGSSFTLTVTVNPKAAITSMTNTTCTTIGFTSTPVNGTNGVVPSGTTYTWTSPSVTGGMTGGASGSGSSITGTLTNTTSSAQTATYTVTPTSGSCGGSSFTLTVTVNPGSTAAVISGTASICLGSSTNLQVAITGGLSPYTVVYTSGSVSSYVSGTNISVSPASTTNYAITSVTDANGCPGSGNSGTATVTLTTTTSTDGGVTWNNGAPSNVKSVVFDGSTGTISSDISGCSLRLTNTATVTVATGVDIALSGAITVDSGSTFTLNNNANLLQNVTTNTNSGNIVVKRDSSALKRLDYTLWSSPVTGQGLYAFSPYTFANRFYVYRYNTDLYNNADVGFSISGLNSDGVNGTDGAGVQFAQAKGYLIRMPWNHPTAATVWHGIFTGVPNSGDISYSLSYSSGHGFNLVGNPYPCPISMATLVANNSSKITGTLYFWRETNGNTSNNAYCTWAGGTFTTNSQAQVFDPSGIIRTGQGFFVEALGASTTLDFNSGQRSTDNTNQFFKTSVVNSSNSVETNRFWLNLTNTTGAFCQMAAGYMTNATDGVDIYDGKNINTGSAMLSSILNNTDYTIQGKSLPFNAADVIPLSCKITDAGNYTITLDHVDGIFTGGVQGIYLKDNLTATVHNLNSGAYTFASAAGTFTNRFEIVYQSQLSNPTFTANTVVIYSHENEFVVNSGNFIMSSIKVFDIRGRLLQEKKGINASETTIGGGLANEVLLVQITSEDGVVVTKKVIR